MLWARRALKNRRVGHCGSLDPLATGLLLLGVGEALRWQERFMGEPKTYRGRLRLGIVTDTDDITGKVLAAGGPERAPLESVSVDQLRAVFQCFVGRQVQRVPLFSAVKVRGRRLYEWARSGVRVDLPQKTVEIYKFELVSYSPPEAEFLVECSRGTYVRALARDVGEKLGVGATLAALCRERIGRFSRERAYPWKGEESVSRERLDKSFLPMEELEGGGDAA